MNAILKESVWDTMSPLQRVRAVNIDIMNHPDFCTLSGLVTMGDVHIVPDLPTAGTNGLDVFYGEDFLMRQTRRQLRYVQCHEALHKGLHHCSQYKDLCKKYPQLSNIAMDYVVNGFIEQTDPQHQFVVPPTDPEPLHDPKHYDKSFVEILQELLRDGRQGQGSGDGGAGGGIAREGGSGSAPINKDQPLDQHFPMPDGVNAKEIADQIEDALNHGDMIQKRMQEAGKKGGGSPLNGLGVKRDTDWRNHLRQFIEEVVAGDEYSRYNPPNRRLLAHDILMPTHFDMAMGELIIGCDTSGSMERAYPVVFGEIANICRQANPDMVRIIWWDTQVRGEQVFKRGEFDQIATLLKPAGGGGTTPACLVDYIKAKNYKPTAVIWLTDGYIDACPAPACANELWGVVDNSRFRPAHGKVLHIQS
jgi:predicted metal-dependent peptidase